jgi:hypothetical protein
MAAVPALPELMRPIDDILQGAAGRGGGAFAGPGAAKASLSESPPRFISRRAACGLAGRGAQVAPH